MNMDPKGCLSSQIHFYENKEASHAKKSICFGSGSISGSVSTVGSASTAGIGSRIKNNQQACNYI